MAKRLTKIYTRTGDDGQTALGDGQRTDKFSARVEAYGAVDELNSTLGLVAAECSDSASVADCIFNIQQDLFDLGGELCIPGSIRVTADMVARLENSLDGFNESLPALEDFILPGGGRASAACHQARAVCRRAERRVWELAQGESINSECPRYLNRLSDLLFVIARVLARDSGHSETLWAGGRLKGKND